MTSKLDDEGPQQLNRAVVRSRQFKSARQRVSRGPLVWEQVFYHSSRLSGAPLVAAAAAAPNAMSQSTFGFLSSAIQMQWHTWKLKCRFPVRNQFPMKYEFFYACLGRAQP
jgi:hypothetical protein